MEASRATQPQYGCQDRAQNKARPPCAARGPGCGITLSLAAMWLNTPTRDGLRSDELEGSLTAVMKPRATQVLGPP